ncbi:chorismate-binding protein [Algoriphagus sp. AK58]|uniref:chorismate-binding protein n=1 Tax=Algoriphagus sp. AK58 TaxID=1406877 RepID=UPI00164F88D4|nr:chorismate-binding protein [Algoriphagus sp. AK58]MBC6365867.1 isochorismate synthase [Algoriphagus sp. AK58]
MNLTESITSITQEEAIHLLFLQGLQSGGSFALWRKPRTQTLEFILDEKQEPNRVGLNLEELPPGFVIHPFADQEDKKAFYIQANQYFKFNLTESIAAEELPAWLQSSLGQTKSKANEIEKLLRANTFVSSRKQVQGSEKESFIHLVNQGIGAIASGLMEKIVPARTKVLELPKGFDLGKTFLQLIYSYPNSFVNFFHIPQVGTWMGATPEVLIETKGDIFYTMALAGTQAAKGDNPLKSAAWTQKEIEEQALVSRYIVDCFKKIRLREYEEHGPKTVMAGNLLHLRSDFKVNMKATGFPQLGSVMLDLLHPTSAVCGMPRREAHEFLQENESFDRSFFAGFLGPVNIESETSIYVNLRTANFQKNQVVLFAGAGVTEDSDPEKEWEETEMKCEIIGKFIKHPSA